MATSKVDVIVLGATGYTGRLVTRYLASHPQFLDGKFTFSLAARSQSKLHTLLQELSVPANVDTVLVDVMDANAIDAVVQNAKVVLNTVGPYWRWGTPVVRACARHGVHYVDLAGETHYIRHIIAEFDYLATKTGAVIIPACGMDSIPSDISAFLSNKTLKANGNDDMATCVTAFNVQGGISGGTISSFYSIFDDVPKRVLEESDVDYSISPVRGRSLPGFQFLYKLGLPRERTLNGAFFVMQPSNKRVVQRTFGLLELQLYQEVIKDTPSEALSVARRARYGSDFAYDEFMVTRSRLRAILFTTAFIIGWSLFSLISPVRSLVKKYVPKPGEGPSDEDLPKGYLKCTTKATSASNPDLHVKTIVKGDGDPGYYLTAIMIVESALSLVLPPISASPPPAASSSAHCSNLPAGLPPLAYQGGVLTPMAALGDVLITRLKDSGKFEFESSVVANAAANGPPEGRKDI